MSRVLIWDLPTRVFHWLFAGSFLGAFAIANLVDDDGALFPFHAMLGLVMGALVVLRIGWGFVGSAPSRFATLDLSPASLLAQVRGDSDGHAHAGHNPGTSWTMLVMFGVALGLGATGLLMSTTGSEVVEELHEVLAWTMLATVGIHLAGIALHTWRTGENIALSMVDGLREGAASLAIPSAQPLIAVALLAVVGAWGGALWAGYDVNQGTITLPGGVIVSVGEGAEGAGPEGEEGEEGEEEDDD